MYIKALLLKTIRKLQERRKGHGEDENRATPQCCLPKQAASLKGAIEPTLSHKGVKYE